MTRYKVIRGKSLEDITVIDTQEEESLDFDDLADSVRYGTEGLDLSSGEIDDAVDELVNILSDKSTKDDICDIINDMFPMELDFDDELDDDEWER